MPRHLRLFLTIVVAAILLMTYQSQRGPIRPFGFLLKPVNLASSVILMAATSVGETVRMAVGQKEEINRLRSEVAGLQLRLQELEEAQLENERLRELLQLREQMPGAVAAARVIARGSNLWSSVYTIDKGGDDGVEKDMAVITPSGLIGKIMEVTPQFSKVLLIDDPRFSVAVRLQDTREEAVLTGKGQWSGTLKYLSVDSAVKEGDVLVTSGLDAMFPPGIRAGYVSKVVTDKERLFHFVETVPAVDLGKLEEVMVVSR